MSYYQNILLEYLNHKNLEYVVVSQIEDFKDHDLDIIISEIHFQFIDQVILEFCNDFGFKLFLRVQHEIKSIRYILVCVQNNEFVFLHPDFSVGYYSRNKFYMSDKEFIENRNANQPLPCKLFKYFLIKRIEKQRIDRKQFKRLLDFWWEDKKNIMLEIKPMFMRKKLLMIEQAFDEKNIDILIHNFLTLKKEIRKRHETKWINYFQYLRMMFDRMIHPVGFWVAFLGPDGAGKSTIIKKLEVRFKDLFRQITIFHYQPLSFFEPSQENQNSPHEKKKRSSITSVIKLFYLCFVYIWGYFTKILIYKIRCSLVMFDRYYHDILIDPLRYRYGARIKMAKFIGRFIPEPDLWIVLRGEPEIILARKKELSFEAIERYNLKMNHFVENKKNVESVDVSEPFSDVLFHVMNVFITRLHEKAKERCVLIKKSSIEYYL